ncbi:hypothetical protein LK09_08255 [Microbacterium mangrovi]|uniref:Uncharacterized protein n=1 Tax=Microbacterium mangrovi TaxID=1348253 RepID=A0A0B2A6Z1_9MICO|nr:hypothetical protein [Microbacterium mangrovi]KHK98850.1 hypothetical protein LK09_08255 [Microbacterium mangrovi]
MKLDRSEIEATIMRVAYASFTYYPAKASDVPGWVLVDDIDWCMEPLANLSTGLQIGFRDRIRLLIIDPEQDKHLFIRDLYTLESAESKDRSE